MLSVGSDTLEKNKEKKNALLNYFRLAKKSRKQPTWTSIRPPEREREVVHVVVHLRSFDLANLCEDTTQDKVGFKHHRVSPHIKRHIQMFLKIVLFLSGKTS